METTPLVHLKALFFDYTGFQPMKTVMLPESGSGRQYYRLSHDNICVIGAINDQLEENEAYFSFTKTFLNHGIAVPKILAVGNNRQIYLVEDIGDDSLYKRVLESKGEWTDDLLALYKKSLAALVKMQVNAGKEIDYKVSYPVSEFNADAIQWDLNYFKYNFLKLSGNDFNELELEKDFQALKNYLLEVPRGYFMFRDFQARNILLKNNEPYFIDFQGGRKGPLAYDVVSLLYQAKAQMPDEIRLQLFNYYFQELKSTINIEYNSLLNSFYGFALLRTLQVLGAYGYRGYFEKKTHFIESIPFAIQNLKDLILGHNFPIKLPCIKHIAENLVLPKYQKFAQNDKLTISITSFSYRKGIPSDPSDNGGGFVFDCRSIHNPGRYTEYQQLTGKDQPVIDFFERENEMDTFLSNVFSLVDTSVEVYMKRNFKHLMVSFGCTGGQHRSVYSAERLAKHLIEKYNVYVNLWHREQD